MIILVSAGARRSTQFNPDPALVRTGDSVVWHVRYVGGEDPIEITVYFRSRSPFKSFPQGFELHNVVDPGSGGVREGSLDGGRVDEPGDYKYGIRLVNKKTQQTLSDDDPWLKVIRSE